MNEKLRILLCLITALAAFLAGPDNVLAGERKPNIVFILVDDMGYGDIGSYGSPDAKTPNLDRLAAQGTRFTQFYANGAECTPSRTAFITGRYPQRPGGLECAIGTGNVGRYDDAIRLRERNDLGLPAAHSVLALALKEAGYTTGVIGKWHLGFEPKFNPLNHGFDYFYGFLGGYVDYFRHREFSDLDVFFRNGEPIQTEGYLTHLITDESVRFIQEHKDRPFFLYIAHATPHFPFQGPNDDTGKMIPEEELMTGTREKFVEMLEDMDAGVGRILQTLDETGLAGETLVVYVSDHGAMPPGRNLPFSGWKGGLLEGGIRVPCIARWPGRLEPGTVSNQVAAIFDWTASFLRVADAQPPDGGRLDGLDILRHVEEKHQDFPRTLHWRARRGDRTWWAVRDGHLKYVRKDEAGRTEEWLFDLLADPAELHSLLPQHPVKADRLRGLLAQWEREVRPAR